MKRFLVFLGVSSILTGLMQAREDDVEKITIDPDDFKRMTGMEPEEFVKHNNENLQGGAGRDDESEDNDMEGDDALVLSKSQLRALHRRIDDDGDGNLHPEELRHFANATRFSMALSERFKDSVVSQLDDDGDGLVDIQREAPEHRSPFEHLKFAAADVDGDGKLSSAELAHMLVPDLNLTVLSKVVSSILNALDKNNDGKVSPQEFKDELGALFEAIPGAVGVSEGDGEADAVAAVFADLDEDQNGKLSRKELIPFATGSLEREMAMEQLVDAADANRDGHVTVQEFEEAGPAIAETDAMAHVMDWAGHFEL